jgi:hypothetical protein
MNHPLLCEINTRCWLRELSDREGRGVTLANVPDAEFARWRGLGFTHIWLMGVWTTGPRAREMALASQGMQEKFNVIVPGWTQDDVPGSPYAIGAYEVPQRLGGNAGLKVFREKLHAAGIKLLLDFVPNHLSVDHPWVTEKPDYIMQGPAQAPETFEQQTASGTRWLAHGKDPNFPPWSDTVQVNYRSPEARAAMIELLKTVASQCDGVRCDMAMLLLNDVFAKTWAHFPAENPTPLSEFWADAIYAIKQINPQFIFLAEAYWGLESRLQALGFDYTYEKTVYDRLIQRDFAGLQKYLFESAPGTLERGAHFLENHDERRIASVLNPAEEHACALLILALPGMRFLYEGQMEGRRIQVPVQLGRWPKENVNGEILATYKQLLGALKGSSVGHGEWKLLRAVAAPEHAAPNLFFVQWQNSPSEFDLAAVNLGDQSSHCTVQPVIKNLSAHDWKVHGLLGGESREVHGGDLEAKGFALDLPSNAARLFHFQHS